MTSRPLIFAAPMVLAILAGRKSQTRRIVKPQPVSPFRSSSGAWVDMDASPQTITELRCPYEPGGLLWVRETWQYADWTDDGEPFVRFKADGKRMFADTKHIDDGWTSKLQDIWAQLSASDNFDIDMRAADRHWRSPIHMPRWASRITLRITDVRVQRLNEISCADAIAEGCKAVSLHALDCDSPDPRDEYRNLWQSLHGEGSWAANPWIWRIEFERMPEGAQ